MITQTGNVIKMQLALMDQDLAAFMHRSSESNSKKLNLEYILKKEWITRMMLEMKSSP